MVRMRGNKTQDEYDGTVARILRIGAMKVKFMVMSGSQDPEDAAQLGGKVLGIGYRINQDEIHFSITPSYHAKRQASSDVVRELTTLTPEDIGLLSQNKSTFSRRQALSMVMSLYDPLGLVSPALVRGKLLLRQLYGSQGQTSWDEDLPCREKRLWANWFGELLPAQEARFPRSTRPLAVVGEPKLCGFCDASAVGTCVCVYVLWTQDSGEVSSRILAGKCRVAPLVGTTIPGGELQSLTMLHRLTLVVCEAYPGRFASIHLFTDSLCSLGALAKSGAAMKPFFANRVSEIHRIRGELTQLTDFLAPVAHVPGAINPADIGTRGLAAISDLGPESHWQQGPSFLRQPFSEWPSPPDPEETGVSIPPEEVRPMSSTIVLATSTALPTDVCQSLYVVVMDPGSKLGSALDSILHTALSREKLELSVRAVARVVSAIISGRQESCSTSPSMRLIEVAIQLLIRSASRESLQPLKQKKLLGLGAYVKGGIVWVSGRVRGEQLAQLLGTRQLPIIMGSTPLAQSVLRKAHRQDHRRAPQDVAARSR